MPEQGQYGRLQQQWLEVKNASRITYPWLTQVEKPPEEAKLERLEKCNVSIHNDSSCFEDGFCISPESEKCPFRGAR